jgi:hypothetical protein
MKDPVHFTGSRDFVADAVDAINNECPGAYIFLCVGIPGTDTTVSFTNFPDPKLYPETWENINETINQFKGKNN